MLHKVFKKKESPPHSPQPNNNNHNNYYNKSASNPPLLSTGGAGGASGSAHNDNLAPPTPTIVRSDTTTQEEIFPPSFSDNSSNFKPTSPPTSPKESKRKRLSQILHLKQNRNSYDGISANVPQNLVQVDDNDDDVAGGQSKDDQWEMRASQLARAGSEERVTRTDGGNMSVPARPAGRSRSPSFTTKGTDSEIQEAIRLHESGDLKGSTRIFKSLADPNGANNPLSQVLYGLALRHGWGVEPNSSEAVKYLRYAANNSADIETAALRAGLKKGGSAKGELVLAIFELGNCYRHAWGVEQDPLAAFNYYQTAANLGDSDAMNETAWCYLNGYGVKKDKFLSAKYYRKAEKAGNKTLGNSWIYKEKYDHPPSPKSERRRSVSPLWKS